MEVSVIPFLPAAEDVACSCDCVSGKPRFRSLFTAASHRELLYAKNGPSFSNKFQAALAAGHFARPKVLAADADPESLA